ncbi:sn-glycerol-3-phosphate ABC transporter substrate-binding protein UgpB [Siccirubricoccus sp. G192]|uniref:sn-glycerol-3-phosphate ABC transporter substrate-binding protein UgpB n=1 Tax=Siccirubricoccus sp. G192 TaxID=2849651 RepID=UPI001C2B7FDC|nr:sn-glycerol-3-phosphate ABC transporter substrate-binding protein UgpB [Siccirubricoccus sp. G192]MBV1797757.1 sn-glycerol-3-phosphate ABC transporter substrate-binding protein UgpB [Siccirubricoccus sp. G192]
MKRRFLAAAALGLAALAGLLPRPAAAQAQPVEIQFWHGLAQPLGGQLEQIVADFNASQPRYRVVPSFRGGYAETMVAAIAAFRANAAPHLVQMFEVGTGTMMAAGRAVKPTYGLLAESGVEIDFGDYLPPVRGYYQAADGRQMSLPFNSSTAVMFWNKDHFRRAGLDPNAPPQTWQEVEQAARKLKAAGLACPLTTAWPAWVQVEQMSALHDVPIATLGNGFGGLGAEMRVNNPLMVRHMNNLIAWQREGLFKYGGRDAAADALFPNGECSIYMGSSGVRSRIIREGRFEWGTAMLPYYSDVAGAPRNSIIGGASFWALNRGPQGGRNAEEWKGVAEFFRYLSQPEVDAKWHMETGYVPVRRASYAIAEREGYYQKNPGAEIPIEQLLRGGETTENTRGIRLGGYVEIRNIIQEEMEKAFQGQQDGQQAMDAVVRRGNQVLRNFERANRQ